MEYSKEQLEKFKKLGVGSFSELALITPNGYEDLRLGSKLIPHMPQIIDATIESIYRAPKSIQITFYAHNFSHAIQGVIFAPKPYMLHQFHIGQRNYFYGVIECKMGHCTIAMPKKVSAIGEITPKYKSTLRSDVMLRFMRANLTIENLVCEGIPEDIAKKAVDIHMPNEEMLEQKSLSEESLEALKYIELHSYMREMRKKRRYFDSMLKEAANIDAWIDSLPFRLSEDQQKAIEDIRGDIRSSYAARRMIVGDVGSGKTMVILAAAMMALPSRSILMAPTTILANQLFEEASKYISHAKIALVTNKSKKEDLSGYDFIIGTHALLYRELPEAAVVMVDEQHRFGTSQRNMLEKLVASGSTKPHYFQFSATPIPRTQAMIESAHIDVSLITTTPFQKDITSKVIQKQNFKELLEHIKSEIALGNQVLLVYPLVEQSEMMEYQSIEEARGYWEKNFDGVYVTHGRDKEKEDVLLEFREKGKILIATTVVEVGISLPRLSTVVIVGAERLGLSTLHQLRGRVSRTGLKGYCFCYTNQKESKRLESFCDTKSGFAIAELDLQFRKSGDLLKGLAQSGKEFKFVDMANDKEIITRVKRDLGI
ncbi:MAG: ATP-dependent DNA helicase RecG [Epsilonproteobacteria bacterium]|nr:ATP-dependent DNA helicase RecG [Campylobacterota bacterium]